MPTLVVPANAAPCQLSEFPEGCKRSKDGALYIRPASVLTVTDDEWNHIRESRPDIASKMIVAKASATLTDRVKNKPDKAKALSERDTKRGAAKKAALAKVATAGQTKAQAKAAAHAKEQTEAQAKRAAEKARLAELHKLGGSKRSAKLREEAAKMAPAAKPKPKPKEDLPKPKEDPPKAPK